MQIQKAIKELIDFLDKLDLPKDNAQLSDYKNKLTPADIAEWQKKLEQLQGLVRKFSTSILIQNRSRNKAEATGEDWLVAQREKNLFKFIISQDVTEHLPDTLNNVSDLFYLMENDLANVDMIGAFGQQMASIYAALKEAEAKKKSVHDCFNQLVSETSETALTYGQVLTLAVGRLFLHIKADEFLVRNKKTLEKVLDSDIETVELDKLAKIWKYTRGYGGPTLSNLKRSFDDFFIQIEQHITKRKLPEHVFSQLLDDLRMCEGLFSLAILKIKQVTRVTNNNLRLTDKEIRVAESFLTKTCQEVVFQLGSNVIDAALGQNIENALKSQQVAPPIVKKSPTEIASIAKSSDTATQALKKDPHSGVKTPIKPNLHNSLFKPVAPRQSDIVKTELTPNMTNICIFYADGSERKYPIANASNAMLSKMNAQANSTMNQVKEPGYSSFGVEVQSISNVNKEQQDKKRKFTLFNTPENSDVSKQPDVKRIKQKKKDTLNSP